MTAIRTPPRNLVLSEVDDAEALRLVVSDLVGTEIPGVLGPKGHAHAFAELWSARTGTTARRHMGERIFRLTSVRPPRPVSGTVRLAANTERAVLIDWLSAFAREALGATDTSDIAKAVDHWLARQGRAMYVWDDRGAVSMCGVGGETPHGIRIGPVYTPPGLRRRGYASAIVAAVSQAQLDRGRQFCFLFTDLANPTSNHIYQEIGYEPVRDVDVFLFES
jgi:predicted GNAT family acetyltransferase